MTGRRKAGKTDETPTPERRVWEPTAIAALLPAVTRPAFRKRSPAAARLLAEWPAAIGPAISAVTTPQRLLGGTLTLACAGPVALELQHLSAALIERLNTHLGQALIERIRFVQAAMPPPAPPARPARRATTEAARRVESLPPGPLRDALTRLGAAVLAERPALPDSDA
jgi:hypothetical protein